MPLRKTPKRIRDAALAALAIAAIFAPAPASAQKVALTGEGERDLDRRLEELLRGDYLLVASDTLIPSGDSIPRSVLVLDATLTLEGAVAGDLVAVDANVFLRPTARIAGDVVNAGGGLYPSALAEVGGRVVDRPLARYRVIRESGTIRIQAQREVERLKLDGIKGFHVPTYNRVDALGIRWGGSYILATSGEIQPRFRGWIGYLSGRGAIQGGAELAAERGRNEAAVGFEEVTATNDAWIRGTLRNSLSFLINGNDYRNYYEARRYFTRVSRRFGAGETSWTVAARAQWEDAESLSAGDPWTLSGGDPRFNPPINAGTISSLILSTEGEWVGRHAAFEGRGSLEFADEILGGDFSFGRFAVYGEWAMDAFADHALEVEGYFQGPLPGTESLPRQRWSFIGGSGTLNTFDISEFLGDRVVFVESRYVIPLGDRFRLPVLGSPDLQIVHAFGMAWTDAVDRELEQNIGLRLQFFGPFVRVMTNPRDPFDHVDFDIGLSWPFDDEYPWRRRR